MRTINIIGYISKFDLDLVREAHRKNAERGRPNFLGHCPAIYASNEQDSDNPEPERVHNIGIVKLPDVQAALSDKNAEIKSLKRRIAELERRNSQNFLEFCRG